MRLMLSRADPSALRSSVGRPGWNHVRDEKLVAGPIATKCPCGDSAACRRCGCVLALSRANDTHACVHAPEFT